MINEWQMRRSVFNHDWLKNNYLNSLDAFILRLSSPNPNYQRLEKFLSEQFPKWEEKKAVAKWLIDNIELFLSPEQLLMKSSLLTLDHNVYYSLVKLAVHLWENKYSIKETIKKCNILITKTDSQYNLLKNEINDADNNHENYLNHLIEHFKEFRIHCFNLSQLISTLPSKARVL